MIQQLHAGTRMKNGAYETGRRLAQKLKDEWLIVSQSYWQTQAEKFAHGHFATTAAQRRFVEGWMGVDKPVFVETEQVTLLIRIMNVQPTRFIALEEELYSLFLPYSKRLEFMESNKVCSKYELEVSVTVLNWPNHCKFFRGYYPTITWEVTRSSCFYRIYWVCWDGAGSSEEEIEDKEEAIKQARSLQEEAEKREGGNQWGYYYQVVRLYRNSRRMDTVFDARAKR